MRKFFYKQLLKRVAVSFRAPFDDVWDIHQSTMAVEGTTHQHHFTGLVVKRWNFGLLHCVPKNGSEEAGNYSSNGTSGMHRPREEARL